MHFKVPENVTHVVAHPRPLDMFDQETLEKTL